MMTSELDLEIHSVTRELTALAGEQQKAARQLQEIDKEIAAGVTPERRSILEAESKRLEAHRQAISKSLFDAQGRRQALVRQKENAERKPDGSL